MTTTETLLHEINIVRLKQKAIAEIIAMAIIRGEHHKMNWQSINEAIKSRWSPSARERVLTMAWKIVDKAKP